ncbi:MAG: transcription antitermination factor NusB [Desulfohalobium sp.]
MGARAHSPLPAARGVALSCLEEVLFQHQDLQASLDAHVSNTLLDARDRGLVTELAYGVCRHKLHLETLLRRYLQPKTRLKPRLRLILTAAAYEIVFLDRVPAYASVDWAVEAVKHRVAAARAGLANAVLRRLGREVEARGKTALRQELYHVPGEHHRDWARAFSCPEWIVQLWREAYGDKRAAALLAASLRPAPVGLRFAPDGQGPRMWEMWRWRPECIASSALGVALSGVDVAEIETLEREQTAQRQSLAAQEALWALGPRQWESPLWDACCGRGGKTFFCQELGLKVVSSDRHRKRLAMLGQHVSQACLADAVHPPLQPGAVRTVLLDVPCSGLGVLSRRPDSKWKRAPEDISQLVALQRRLLRAAWAVLPVGGRLVYMTCTCIPAENEDQVAWMQRDADAVFLEKQWQTPWDSVLGEFFFTASLVKRG